jgi:hypothetical protein
VFILGECLLSFGTSVTWDDLAMMIHVAVFLQVFGLSKIDYIDMEIN